MKLSYMPRAEYTHRGGESAQERPSATVSLLEYGIDSILSSEGFAAYHQTMARFHSYSFGNVALILTQRPEATRVAGYKTWQQLGRQVRKGEEGIRILVPHKRRIVDEETEEETIFVRSFGVGTVFDVSQTDRDPLPEPPKAEVIAGASEVGMRLFVDLIDFLEEGVSFGRERLPSTYGSYDPLRRRVTVAHYVDADQATKTLTHETAHYVARHMGGMDAHDVETVAESRTDAP